MFGQLVSNIKSTPQYFTVSPSPSLGRQLPSEPGHWSSGGTCTAMYFVCLPSLSVALMSLDPTPFRLSRSSYYPNGALLRLAHSLSEPMYLYTYIYIYYTFLLSLRCWLAACFSNWSFKSFSSCWRSCKAKQVCSIAILPSLHACISTRNNWLVHLSQLMKNTKTLFYRWRVFSLVKFRHMFSRTLKDQQIVIPILEVSDTSSDGIAGYR